MRKEGKSKRYKSDKGYVPYVHLIPFLPVLLLICVSIVEIAVQSLGGVPGYSQDYSPTAYIRVFTNSNTLSSIGLSFYIAIASTVPSVILGVFTAWCIVTLKQETALGALLGRLPLQIPHALACVLIVNMFMPTGIIARILETVGIQGASDLFNQVLFFPNSIGVILEYIWKESGYVCFMVLPVMSGISNRLGEAAINLGASPFRNFLTVTLPHCMPTVRTVAIIVFAYTFGAYETPFFLGSSVSQALPVIAYSEYGLANMMLHRPVAMALNMVLIVISVIASFAYYLFSIKRERALGGAANGR